jgi:predicted glycoside hydrolase/deacetylase ChbG (UPF0249 family)
VTNPHRPPVWLIVNADDYGYFDCVSRGILEAALHGVVTATGIFANSARFDEHVGWLAEYPELDLGVHLNLTDGQPLTEDLRRRLSRSSGRFPGKYAIAKAVLTGKVGRDEVTGEWRAQIDRCLDKGLEIRFLNSHEHIHMLPRLFSIVQALAEEYAIPHLRFSTPERPRLWTAGALVRDTAMRLLAAYNRGRSEAPTADFLGMGISGRLDGRYLAETAARMQPGRVYELMCHPGRCAGEEVGDPRLLRYHDWQGELKSLTDLALKEELAGRGVRLVGYRQLQIQGGRLAGPELAP